MIKPLYSAVLVLLAAFYYAVVPSDTIMLSSLPNETSSHGYKPDTWTENGWVELSHGKTHYHLIGPQEGKKIVFIHGMGSPPPLLKPFLDKFAGLGYRILAYDLYGRGHSDSPAVKYDDGLFIGQVIELLHKLRWGRTSIVGYSLGGLITTGFVSRYPEMVENVGYIAPAGLMTGLPPMAMLLKIPVFGNIFLHLFGGQIITHLSTKSHKPQFLNIPDVEWFNKLQTYHINNNPGFLRAFGSTVLNVKWGGYAERYRSLETSHKGRVFAIWGELDEVVPTVLHLELQDLIPSAKIIIHKDYSHSIPMENSKLVAEELDQFFSSLPASSPKSGFSSDGNSRKGWFGLL